MKVLVVLALAVFSGEFAWKHFFSLHYWVWETSSDTLTKPSFVCPTGCNANLFYADAPKPQMEVMTEAFWDYVAKATQTADDTIQMIKKTQFGQDVRYLSLWIIITVFS